MTELILDCDGKGCGRRYIVPVERLALNDEEGINLIDLSAHPLPRADALSLDLTLALPEGWRCEGQFPEFRVYCQAHPV